MINDFILKSIEKEKEQQDLGLIKMYKLKDSTSTTLKSLILFETEGEEFTFKLVWEYPKYAAIELEEKKDEYLTQRVKTLRTVLRREIRYHKYLVEKNIKVSKKINFDVNSVFDLSDLWEYVATQLVQQMNIRKIPSDIDMSLRNKLYYTMCDMIREKREFLDIYKYLKQSIGVKNKIKQ